MHSIRGMNLVLKQLTQLATQNRKRLDPWPLNFVNFDCNDSEVLIKQCEKFIF